MGSFQELLNRTRGIVPNSTITNTESPGAPSQMPMDMGGGIQQMPYRYGEQGQEGIQQMPYRETGEIPGTAIGNMGGIQEAATAAGFSGSTAAAAEAGGSAGLEAAKLGKIKSKLGSGLLIQQPGVLIQQLTPRMGSYLRLR